MQGQELWKAGAGELAALIRAGDVSSREVIDAHLARIAEVNPRLNAVTTTLENEAREAAAKADADLAAGRKVGPLHGVPVSVKENVDVAGSATTQGIAAFAGMIPPVDAPHIAQLRAAGAIVIARTNMPDFGVRWHTDNALHGATINPWDADRVPGGSSGGDAAALASGMVPLAIAGDYGGSIRIPAQACGVAGIRATLGRVPFASAFQPPDSPITLQMFTSPGPMARRVADLRLALAAMSGPDPRDPWYAPVPLAGDPLPRKVAVTIDPAGQGVDPDVADGVRKAARALADAGWIVDEVEPPSIAAGADLWNRLVGTELQMTLMPLLEKVGAPDTLRFQRFFLDAIPALSYAEYVQAFATRNEFARAWSLFMAEWPLVLGPVSALQPPRIGFDLKGPDEAALLVQAHRLIVMVNLLGLPSAALPVGVAGGQPQAVQIIGPRFREDLCLDAAQAVEDRLGALTPIDPRHAHPEPLTAAAAG